MDCTALDFKQWNQSPFSVVSLIKGTWKCLPILGIIKQPFCWPLHLWYAVAWNQCSQNWVQIFQVCDIILVPFMLSCHNQKISILLSHKFFFWFEPSYSCGSFNFASYLYCKTCFICNSLITRLFLECMCSFSDNIERFNLNLQLSKF